MNYTYSEGYDANNRYYSKVTATNAKGAVSEEISNANGNVIKTTDKGISGDTAIETAYEYDARGNLVKEIHSAGDYITYSYDSLGRVIEKQQYSSAGVQLYRTVYTYYSGLNLVKDMKDYEAGTLYRHTYYEYDSLGRISAKAESNSEMTDAEKSAKAVSYTYNLRGEVTGTGYGSSLTNIAAGEISGTRYEYNSYGQLTGVYVRKGTSEYKVKEYSYTPSGNVMQVKDFYNYTSGTGQYIALSYSYDAYGRVTAMVYEGSNGAVIEKHEYAYNRNGQVIKETNLNNVSVNPVNETRSYTYDYMGNLLKSEITGSANVTTLYTYDKVGNRLTKKQNNVTTTYTYNGLNQLTGESGGGNSLSYVYDANGNQIRITGTADGTSVNKVFAYTPSGMMSSYTSGAGTQVNRYNGDGQRVSKAEGSDVTNYFYQDGSVLYTTDSQGNVKAFNLLNVSDILGTLRINGNNVSSYFYTEDMRGSTVNVIDNSGNTVLSYWYDDFGQVNEYRESGNSLINEVQYTGAIYDELTGLLYLNARFYDPATGRFISQDTYRGERDDAGTWHLYAYCANDPINYVDPSGHIPLAAPVLLFGAAVIMICGAWQASNVSGNAWRGVQKEIDGLSSGTRTLAGDFVNKLNDSFAKMKEGIRYRYKSARHHIVAKSDKRAAKSRKILKACGIWINSSNNIVRLKTSMHVRVHSNEYHGFVQESLERVYTKNDNYETNREKVKCVLYKIKRFLRALNKTCP